MESSIKSRRMILNKQKIIHICGVSLCKWSEISVSVGISPPPSLVSNSWSCALWFFICAMVYIQVGQLQLCGDPLSLDGTAFLQLIITHLLKSYKNHSQIEYVLACVVLNRNPVVTSVLLRFVFVSLGFYHVFTNMLRIHLFFLLIWEQKHCCSLKSH